MTHSIIVRSGLVELAFVCTGLNGARRLEWQATLSLGRGYAIVEQLSEHAFEPTIIDHVDDPSFEAVPTLKEATELLCAYLHATPA